MGEIADMMLEGDLCGTCGTYMEGESQGFPRYCSKACDPERYEPRVPRFNRYAIKDNPKVQKPGDPLREGGKMACPFCVRKVKVTGFGDHMLNQHRDKWPSRNTASTGEI